MNVKFVLKECQICFKVQCVPDESSLVFSL